MKTLYLVGNGFDIQHGIRTPYSEFRSFLETHHESFLTDFEAMYNIQPLDDTESWYTEAAQERWKKSVLKDLWQTFEEEMGNPDVEGMHDMASSLAEQMPEEGIKYIEQFLNEDAKCFKNLLENLNDDDRVAFGSAIKTIASIFKKIPYEDK